MTTSPVSTAPPVSATPASNSGGTDPLADKEVFLQLLVAQLKYQDPLSPADGTQFVTQVAQFSTLEQTTRMASDLDTIRDQMSKSTSVQAPPSAASSEGAQPAPSGANPAESRAAGSAS